MAGRTVAMGRCIDKRIRMTGGAVRAGRGYDTAVIRRGGMDGAPGRAVTGGTIAASGRDTRFQVRNGCMAEGTVTIMRQRYCSICGSARIMTACA
jgi:hypothetical protein